MYTFVRSTRVMSLQLRDSDKEKKKGRRVTASRTFKSPGENSHGISFRRCCASEVTQPSENRNANVGMMLLHKRLTVELATPAGTFLRIR